MSSQPPSGFIHFVLLSQYDPFYLEIPTTIVAELCLKPVKYLRYLGWSILGVIGDLKDSQGNVIPLDGELNDRGTYRYVLSDGQDVLEHAVDLEVIRQRTQVPSQTTGTRESFRKKVLERDGRCVWTGLPGVGMHIIPLRRGDEWFRLVVDNRPHDENLDSLFINDIRNGFCADDTLHDHFFEARDVVVLKTPNPILETTDVPERCQRVLAKDVSYPYDSRYTLQWIITPEVGSYLKHFPNNNDATFMDHSLPKPADLLLHYNYGAAVVKKWGRNVGVLANRPNIPRPSVLVPAALGSTVDNDRSVVIQKWAAAMSKGGQGVGSESEGAAADSEVQKEWDEDDVMLFLWGNSKQAREWHAQREREHNEYMESWRAAVTGTPEYIV